MAGLSFKRALCLLSLVCGWTPVYAVENWLTLVGDAEDPTADYVQLDPSRIAVEDGLKTIPIRISRAGPRTSQDGIVFRSVTGMAGIDCKTRSARFLRASFYAEPDFRGQPIATRDFGPQVRPIAFRDIKGSRPQQVIRGLCGPEARP